VEKFRRLNTTVVEREVIRAGEESDEEFLGPGVRVLPQPDLGMGEVLSRVVGDDANDLDLSGEGRFEEFAQEMEPAIEAAEDDHSRPTLGLPR
jgi:hypothetical protein